MRFSSMIVSAHGVMGPHGGAIELFLVSADAPQPV